MASVPMHPHSGMVVPFLECLWLTRVHLRGLISFRVLSAGVGPAKGMSLHLRVPATARHEAQRVQSAESFLPETPIWRLQLWSPVPWLGVSVAKPNPASVAEDCQGQAEGSLGRGVLSSQSASCSPGMFLGMEVRELCEWVETHLQIWSC